VLLTATAYVLPALIKLRKLNGGTGIERGEKDPNALQRRFVKFNLM
jgi:hypothetical protein